MGSTVLAASAYEEEATAPSVRLRKGESMEKFLEVVNSVNKAVNDVVWGPVMLILLIGTGAYLTIRTGCIQLTKFSYIWRNTIGSLFKKKDGNKGDGKNLTAFEAVSTALASTVGTGNIAGVTGAIFTGGQIGRASCRERV